MGFFSHTTIMDIKLLGTKTSYSLSILPYHNYVRHKKFMSMRPIMSLRPSNVVPKTIYSDSWLDLMAINYVSRNLQAVSGMSVEEEGYIGLVETCKAVSLKYSPLQQRQLSLDSLNRGIPTQVFHLLKAILPNTKCIREMLAKTTSLCFAWLVGPSQVKESELNGQTEKNVVHIKKCRFLESSNCVGMCTNLCKLPSQTFINDSLGVPVTMVPSKIRRIHSDALL
ncbi:beta-carotene isomerase D27, chloroplastic isoform X2 [Silene latifolia]|uniref:beta-carotene isomerase D27, chloroplastic isoform X2 n=1 Tax=Silene latifolia TaxID=37657 RepID=UPI003D76CE55